MFSNFSNNSVQTLLLIKTFGWRYCFTLEIVLVKSKITFWTQKKSTKVLYRNVLFLIFIKLNIWSLSEVSCIKVLVWSLSIQLKKICINLEAIKIFTFKNNFGFIIVLECMKIHNWERAFFIMVVLFQTS